MSLSAFNAQGRVVAIRSRVLECEVVLAADGAVLPPTEDRPIYRVAELVALLQVSPGPEGMRQIHAAKMEFGGTVLAGEGE